MSQTESFYHTNCKIPAYNEQDSTIVIARDLVNVFLKNAKNKTTIHNAHGPDLKNLANIFGTTTTQKVNLDNREQRVDSSSSRNDSPQLQPQEPAPSTATTNKIHIEAQPKVHQKNITKKHTVCSR